MSAEAAVPPDLLERIRQIAAEEVQKYARSGPLRNARISGGEGLTVTAGSKMRVEHPDGSTMVHAGIYDNNETFDLPDGSHQPMFLLRRADGTLALAMYDPAPGFGGFQQFLALLDRAGNVILSDDTDSGQGLARPYIPGSFYRTRFADMSVATTSASFETMWGATLYKQHPQLVVGVLATTDVAGTSGQVRVLVNGAQLGTTQTLGFAGQNLTFGAAPVPGAHMGPLLVEVQGCRTGGTGALRVEPRYMYGQQS